MSQKKSAPKCQTPATRNRVIGVQQLVISRPSWQLNWRNCTPRDSSRLCLYVRGLIRTKNKNTKHDAVRGRKIISPILTCVQIGCRDDLIVGVFVQRILHCEWQAGMCNSLGEVENFLREPQTLWNDTTFICVHKKQLFVDNFGIENRKRILWSNR